MSRTFLFSGTLKTEISKQEEKELTLSNVYRWLEKRFENCDLGNVVIDEVTEDFD